MYCRQKYIVAGLVCLIFAFHFSYAQKEYFQQEVNYTISVKLNDRNHTLSGVEQFEYINHSPDTLKYIYIHLWPNAYKNSNTAMAQQMLQLKNTSFYYSKPEERGYIDSLNFQIDSKPCKWAINKDTIDIGIIYLNEPLLPGKSIIISTPFFVKIPDAKFSRLGHADQAYYITQWYPKPAVYDKYGWHPMPYLHNGEFFSEFGSFDVTITVPQNYYLAATGTRIDDSSETKFIQDRINYTKQLINSNSFDKLNNDFPISATQYKTIRFLQSNVHDFAWFADKRFLVLNDEIELFESKKKVQTYLFFTPQNIKLWKDALEYINEATLFYSYYVGDYPYQVVTAVDGSSAAGGGMEYPTITLINKSDNAKMLEETIVHEVGHNWFYGILASNEREYPVMDEGMNSFYEMRYLYTKYPYLKLSTTFGLKDTNDYLGIGKLPQKKYYQWAYLLMAAHNADMPMSYPAYKYTEMNYGCIVYAKTAVVMDYLKNYFTDGKFDDGIAFYYRTFKFKHPYPADFKTLLDYFEGGHNLKLFEDLTTTNKKIDYRIAHIRHKDGSYQVKIKNKGQLNAPFVIQAIKNNQIITELWKTDISKTMRVSFPPDINPDYFRIDYNEVVPDIDKHNNTIRTKGLFRKVEPLQFNFGWRVDNPYKTQIHYLPMVGWNYNDGTLLGLSFYNLGIFPKKWEFNITPLYGLKSKEFDGSADVYRNIFPYQTPFKIIQVGTYAKKYTYQTFNDVPNVGNHFNYAKIEPYVNIIFKQKNPLNHYSQYLKLNTSIIFEDDFSTATSGLQKITQSRFLSEYLFGIKNTGVLYPFTVETKIEHTDKMVKLSAYAFGKIAVPNLKKNFFEWRIFGGSFVSGSTADKAMFAFRPSGYTNYQDYAYNNYYLGRYNTNTLLYQNQFVEKEGNMKTYTALGYSTTWMAAINLKSPAVKFPIHARLFFDAVMTDANYTMNAPVLYDAGIELVVVPNIWSVYIPLAMSKELQDNLKLNGYDKWYKSIRISLNIGHINPRFMAVQNIE